MNIDEIKAELKARGWTYAMLADKLGMSEGRIKTIMSGKDGLKKTLRNHIELLFASPASSELSRSYVQFKYHNCKFCNSYKRILQDL